MEHAQHRVDVLAFITSDFRPSASVVLQAQVDLSTFDDVPGPRLCRAPCRRCTAANEACGCACIARRPASSSLTSRRTSAPETLQVCTPQPGFRLLFDRSFQRPAIGQDRDTERLLASKRRCRCDPVLRSRSPAGGSPRKSVIFRRPGKSGPAGGWTEAGLRP